jgi:small subunit ribosomal protein S16
VARSEAARDGSFLEILGSYYPRTKPAKIEVDRERVNYWMSKGAKPSDTVRTLIARHLPPAPPAGETATAASVPTPPAAARVDVAPVARPEPPADVAPAATPEPTPAE